MERLDCPVCPRRAIAAGAAACPNCSVDLAPLWRVRALSLRRASVRSGATASGNARLGAAPGSLDLTVTGSTDGRPVSSHGRWPDNWSLGLARARAAASVLRQVLPGQTLLLSSASTSGGDGRSLSLRLVPVADHPAARITR